MHHRRWIAAVAILAGPFMGSTAHAATLTVDDDRADCPAAGYVSVQSAVDAAASGDTVVLCPGRYTEGTGLAGTNAVTIAKSLTLRGAGADLVTISPRASSLTGSSIAKPTPDLRSGTGDILAVTGIPNRPLDVAISGVTVDGESADGRAVASEAGVVFLDATGTITRSRVTDVVTSEGDTAFQQTGGWRDPTIPGYGIVQTSSTREGLAGERRLTISRTRVDRYNRGGILVDGATNDAPPYVASGATNKTIVSASQIVGRVECVNFQANGNCSNPGLLTTGPLWGQDGIRVTTGGRLAVSDSLIAQNLVNGDGAPTRSTYTSGAYTAQTTNNANLNRGAGIRLLGASLTAYSAANGQTIYSSATRSNITDNAYGVLNLAADGATEVGGAPTSSAALGNVFKAENNWWGLGYYRDANAGPALSPTTNPPIPENPVSIGPAPAPTPGPGPAPTPGPVPDGAGQTSRSVDFFPFRNGQQGNGDAGQYPLLDAPAPIDDAAPTATLSGPATADRGTSVQLAATPADDIGVKAVRLYEGATLLQTTSTPPYALSVPIAADAACGTVRSFTATAEDTLGQTAASAPVTVTATCPATPQPGTGTPGPGTPPLPDQAPSVKLTSAPATLRAASGVAFEPNTPAGFGAATVLLGDRRVCTVKAAPYRCTVRPTGADVGGQTLRVVVTDARGSTAEASQPVTVPRFSPRLEARVSTRARKGGRLRRTVKVTVKRPSGVTAAQGCKSGNVRLVVKRGDRTAIDEQVRLKGSCVVSRAVTASRRGASFQATARFGGNAVLRAASTSRRFK